MANDFKAFANDPAAFVVSQVAYEALLAGPLVHGFVAGLAPSAQLNKVWRQSSLMAAAVAQTINDITGSDVLDSGVTATLTALLEHALQAVGKLGYVLDTGIADAYVGVYTPVIAAYVNGMVLSFKAVNANTGASTLNAGAGAISLRNSAGNALAAGDIAAGQIITVIYDSASGFFRVVGLTASQSLAQHGQCQLSKSGATLLLLPLNGNRLVVNGVAQTIPDAGVTLAVGAALTEGGIPVADTTYYIYAFMNAGVLTLQASATGHSRQANTGIEIRTGDATRSLVGMARTTAAPAWVDSNAQRFVRSWFNSPRIAGTNAFVANRSTTSLTYVELSSSERAEFLNWANEGVLMHTSGWMVNSLAGGAYAQMSIAFDDAIPEDTAARVGSGSTAVTGPASCSLSVSSLAEGYHYATIVGLSSDGSTCTWAGNATGGSRTTIMATIG